MSDDPWIRRALGEVDLLTPERVAKVFGIPPHMLGEFPREPEPTKLPAAVIGYRVWLRDGSVLHPTMGMFSPPPWFRGVNQADCNTLLRTFRADVSPDHEAPSHGCGCGLHAFHDPVAALDYVRHEFRTIGGRLGPDYDGLAFGAVVAWGRMEVATNGFRAQYAQIVAVDSKEAAEYYGVPAASFDEIESVAREHGDPVPVELRPEPLSKRQEAVHGAVLRPSSVQCVDMHFIVDGAEEIEEESSGDKPRPGSYVRGGFGPVDEPPQPFT